MRILAFPKSSEWNPYTSLLYSQVEHSGVEVIEFDPHDASLQGDVLHVHWPEWFLGRRNPIAVWRAYRSWTGALRRLKAGGTKVVWTVHNLRSHERRHEGIQRRFWREFIQLVDGCIFLSETSRTMASKQFSGLTTTSVVVPHGHYRDVYPCTVNRGSAREALGVSGSAFVFVHVGMIRAYKNVPELIEAFRRVPGDALLLIAGEVFDRSLREQIESAAAADPRVRLRLARIEGDRLQAYFRAADLAVFPYRDILNSGSALMALSFDTPVLVPAIGSMPELADQVGPEWVRTYAGAISSEVLAGASKWVETARRNGPAPLDDLGWDRIGRATVDFYRHVCGTER